MGEGDNPRTYGCISVFILFMLALLLWVALHR